MKNLKSYHLVGYMRSAAGGSEFPPNHLINHSHVALDYLHDLSADVFVGVVWNRCAVITILH